MIAPVVAAALLSLCDAQAVGRSSEACSTREALRLDFEDLPPGALTPIARERHWATNPAATERAHVVRDTPANRLLVVEYPKDRAGSPESGAVFVVDVPPAADYYLSYRFKLSESFDFRKGGKLPGLSSRGCTFSGGHIPAHGEGWSARLVWGPDGRIAVYLYHAGMRGPFGESLHLSTGPLRKDEWHTIVEHVVLNTGDAANGILRVWLDGEIGLDRTDIRFRSDTLAPIESLCVSTFHGGRSRTEFGPRSDGTAAFDDFVVTSPADPACHRDPTTSDVSEP